MNLWEEDSPIMSTIINGIEHCSEHPQVAFAALMVIERCIPQTETWEAGTIQSRIAFYEKLRE